MFAKLIIVIAWLFAIGHFFFPYTGLAGTIATWLFWILVISHLAETLFVFKRIKADSEPLLPSLISSFVFGHLHNKKYM